MNYIFYLKLYCMYVRVLGDDGPSKIMAYHVIWSPSRNIVFTYLLDAIFIKIFFCVTFVCYVSFTWYKHQRNMSLSSQIHEKIHRQMEPTAKF